MREEEGDMLNLEIDEGIERYIKYMRRMSTLTNEQLRILLGVAITKNPDAYTGIGIDIEGHIAHIRNASALSDDQLRASLKNSAGDPVMREVFEDAAKKRALLDMQKMAKDIKGDARKFARRVDEI